MVVERRGVVAVLVTGPAEAGERTGLLPAVAGLPGQGERGRVQLGGGGRAARGQVGLASAVSGVGLAVAVAELLVQVQRLREVRAGAGQVALAVADVAEPGQRVGLTVPVTDLAGYLQREPLVISSQIVVALPGSAPAGVTADSSGNWLMTQTGTITLPSSGLWTFCIADNQSFTMKVDGNVALTNDLYEEDGNNGDVNQWQLGSRSDVMPVQCESTQLSGGQHQLELDIQGNTGLTTSYNLAYQPPGSAAAPIAVPQSIVTLSTT